jgi:hypothetical protein
MGSGEDFEMAVGRASGAALLAALGTLTFGSTLGSGITGSVGSSVMNSANGGGANGASQFQGSQNNVGDPLSLLFLVQGVAVTSKLRSAPKAYRRDFAGSLKIFNLQGIRPPQWAFSLTNSLLSDQAKAPFIDSRRRLTWYNHQTGETVFECPCASSDSSILSSIPSSGSWSFPSNQNSYHFSASNFTLPKMFTVESWIKPFSTSSAYSWCVLFMT